MAEKKSKGTKAPEKGVMASLPSTRPARVGGRRRGSTANPGAPAGEATVAAVTKSSAKPAGKTKPAAKPRPAAKAKPAAKRKPAAKKKAGATPAVRRPVLTAVQNASEPPTPKRPRPVRAGAPGLKDATAAAEERAATADTPKSTTPSGSEIVSTAIQAAGELAQIGLTIGGQLLKRAVEKLPKP